MSHSKYLDEDIAVISKSGLFDAAWYLEHSKDVRSANVDPVRHYVLHGEKEGRQPNRELSLDHYINNINPALIEGRSPLAHYIMNHNPLDQIDIISRSGLFDKTWYLENYHDVRESEIEPVKHYVYYGALEGRMPNADLALVSFLNEVGPAVIGNNNPLVQYILSNRLECNIAIINKSGLFDQAWYLEKNRDVQAAEIEPIRHYVLYGEREGRQPNKKLNLKHYIINATPEIGRDQSPLVHYILYGRPELLIDPGKLRTLSLATIKLAIDRLQRLPIYAAADYVDLNNDIKPSVLNDKIEPAAHALTYGVPEGRRIFKTLRIAQVLGESARRPFPAVLKQGAATIPSLPAIGVYFNTSGNVFIKELAEELVDALRLLGLDVQLFDDKSPHTELAPVPIIVAPHEFFHIGDGRRWVTDEVIARSLMYNTEQPQTLWFERAVPFILASRGVIDICAQIADIFQQSGMPSTHFNPNATAVTEWLLPGDTAHAFYKILPAKAKPAPDPAAPFLDRPIDISFFGSVSRHRETFFSKNAGFLADYNTFIYYRKFSGPMTAGDRDGILSRIGRHVTAHSKIALNIHRDELGFFEWHRLVKLGMMGGSVVVTEPCLPHPLYKPQIHYLEETTRHMPDLIEWLVKSKDGQAKAKAIQKNVTDITQKKYAIQNSLGLAKFLKNYGT